MNVLIPLAGSGKLFRCRGLSQCKALVEIEGKPMIQHVVENLAVVPRDRLIFVIRKDEDERFFLGQMLQLIEPRSIVLRVAGGTAGAACTALLALQWIDSEEELVITNGDQVFLSGPAEAVADFQRRCLDAGTLVFESVHPRWSYVRVNEDGFVSEAAEKRPISRHATAGFYYFRHGAAFVKAAVSMIRKNAHVRGRFYVCPTFNELILRQARVGIFSIEKSNYLSLARPEDLEAFTGRMAAGGRHAPVSS